MGRYEFFDHVADVGIRIHGESLEDLFVTAAFALMAWIGPPPESPTYEDKVSLEAQDLEELIVRWLQEILCRFHLQHAYLVDVSKISVDLKHIRMEASLLNGQWNEDMRGNYQEVKAVTYHQLKIEQAGSTWLAAVILDI